MENASYPIVSARGGIGMAQREDARGTRSFHGSTDREKTGKMKFCLPFESGKLITIAT